MTKYFLGIDVGTQGARVVLVDDKGKLIASGAHQFELEAHFREEQSPEYWWRECVGVIDRILENLPQDFDRLSIHAVSVTSTSGTVIPLDSGNSPLHNALMYSDGRAVQQARRAKEIAEKYVESGYTGFNVSSGISKMLWYIETYPERVEDIALWVHASDFIVGKLSGNYRQTDYTNALKSAYDLVSLCWPNYIFEELGLKKEWLQEVVPSGTIIGCLLPELADRWKIGSVAVVVGITDGCASQIASGAVNPGEWNTTIGTTLVIKGVTQKNVLDPLGRVYSHRHPDGYWMPGGASNTGADWISIDFPTGLDALNIQAEKLIPTGKLSWPLKQKGERYPLMAPQARAIVPQYDSKEELYAANLEGVAFIERLAYETIEELSGEKVEAVYTAGGGSNSEVWLRIRSAVLKVPIYKCNEPSGALGAAIIAASQTYYHGLQVAAARMTSLEKKIYPDTMLMDAYESQYQEFKIKLKTLKYMG